MDLELSLTSAPAKARALDALKERGYAAGSGPVRLAYPFAIVVEDVVADQQDEVVRLVSRVDPCAGRIVAAPDPEGPMGVGATASTTP